MYIFNMVQHTKSGDVVAPALAYNSVDAWKAKVGLSGNDPFCEYRKENSHE